MKRRDFLKIFPVATIGAACVAVGVKLSDQPKQKNGMRLSALPSDPAYSPDCLKYEVYLNGKKVKDCHTADERTGECLVYDNSGPFYPSGFSSKTLRGKVKLVKVG